MVSHRQGASEERVRPRTSQRDLRSDGGVLRDAPVANRGPGERLDRLLTRDHLEHALRLREPFASLADADVDDDLPKTNFAHRHRHTACPSGTRISGVSPPTMNT